MLGEFPVEILREIFIRMEASVDDMYDQLIYLAFCGDKKFKIKFDIAMQNVSINYWAPEILPKPFRTYVKFLCDADEDVLEYFAPTATQITKIALKIGHVPDVLHKFISVKKIYIPDSYILNKLPNFPLMTKLSLESFDTKIQKQFPNVSCLSIGLFTQHFENLTLFANLTKLHIYATIGCKFFDVSHLIFLEHLEFGADIRGGGCVDEVELNIGNLKLIMLILRRRVKIDLQKINFEKMKCFVYKKISDRRSPSYNANLGPQFASQVKSIVKFSAMNLPQAEPLLKFFTNLKYLAYDVRDLDNILGLKLWSLKVTDIELCANWEKISQMLSLKDVCIKKSSIGKLVVLMSLDLLKLKVTVKCCDENKDLIDKLMAFVAQIPHVHLETIGYVSHPQYNLLDIFAENHKGISRKKISYEKTCRNFYFGVHHFMISPKFKKYEKDLDEWLDFGYMDTITVSYEYEAEAEFSIY
jgi:hypothetical protein